MTQSAGRWQRREGLRQAIAELTFEQREVLSLRLGRAVFARRRKLNDVDWQPQADWVANGV